MPLVEALARVTTAPARDPRRRRRHAARSAARPICCIFDPPAPGRVRRDALRSQGKNTPFLGLEVTGKVRFTLLSGRVVHEA